MPPADRRRHGAADPAGSLRASAWPHRRPADGIIDWETRAPYLYDWVRAQTRPYPGAFTFLGDEKVVVWRARPVELDDAAPAGTIVAERDEGPVVACGEGGLLLEEVETRRSGARGRGEARLTRVLVIAAHPDDEVLGMGGTIALHTGRGDAVRVLVVTDGSSSAVPGRRRDSRAQGGGGGAAARELGVSDYVHLDLPDMRLDTVPHVELNAIVEEHVREHSAEVVYTVQPDINLDHRAFFDSVAVATRPVPGQAVRRVLTYAPTSSTEWTPAALNWFVPNWYVDVTATLEQKVAAFSRYETELREYPHPRSERAIRAAAEYHGTSCGCEYAEPFCLVRSLEPL